VARVEPRLREGDIEALRRKMKLEGRPIKSTAIVDGNVWTHYKVREGKKVEIADVYDDRTESNDDHTRSN
jgi:hypothetical protein